MWYCGVKLNCKAISISELETGQQNPPPLCRLKLVYSYVIEVADSKYQLHLHHKGLVLKIFVFFHLIENALGRPGRRGRW